MCDQSLYSKYERGEEIPLSCLLNLPTATAQALIIWPVAQTIQT